MTTFDKKEKEAAKILADLISKNIQDITDAVVKNLGIDDEYSLIAAYSGLVSVMSYFDYRLRENGTTDFIINKAKIGAEDYLLGLIADELNLSPQKKGDA